MTSISIVRFIAVFMSIFLRHCDGNLNLSDLSKLEQPLNATPPKQIEYDFKNRFLNETPSDIKKAISQKIKHPSDIDKRYMLLTEPPMQSTIKKYLSSNNPPPFFMTPISNSIMEPIRSNNYENRNKRIRIGKILNRILSDMFLHEKRNIKHVAANTKNSLIFPRNLMMLNEDLNTIIKPDATDILNKQTFLPVSEDNSFTDNKIEIDSTVFPILNDNQPGLFNNDLNTNLNRNFLWLGKVGKPLILVRNAKINLNKNDLTSNHRLLFFQQPDVITKQKIDEFKESLISSYSPFRKYDLNLNKWPSSRLKITWFANQKKQLPVISRLRDTSDEFWQNPKQPLYYLPSPFLPDQAKPYDLQQDISSAVWEKLLRNQKIQKLDSRLRSIWLDNRLLQKNNNKINVPNFLTTKKRYERSVSKKKKEVKNRLKSIWLVTIGNKPVLYRSFRSNLESSNPALC